MSDLHTIMIVDDDTVSLNLLCKLVERLRYNVVKAADGAEAWTMVSENPVDLIIADFDMPGMDGLELLKKVKAEYPRLPYILVTAYSNLRVIREAWEHGAFDFFQKPVFVDRLNQTIRLAIEYGHLSIARRKFPKLEELEPDPDLINVGVVRELAIALEREDLLRIVEEFETHARVEMEQVLRHSFAHHKDQVRSIAHRLAGTAINLGLIRVSEEMRGIESHPDRPIDNGLDLAQLLERSIFWLRHYLTEVFQDLAA